VRLVSFDSLYDIGKKKLLDYNSEEFKVLPEDCLTFSYTSGTTGPPKGAMISHKNFTSFMAAQSLHKNTKFNTEDVALSYLPLPHIL
jgi:long-chain acyl-CoA synthetase